MSIKIESFSFQSLFNQGKMPKHNFIAGRQFIHLVQMQILKGVLSYV